MKSIPTIVLLCALVPARAAPLKPVLACQLSGGQQIELLSEARGLDGDALFLKFSGAPHKAFDDFPDAEFVGKVALAKCVDRVLVFGLNYGPPYLKGGAIRANPTTRKIERIDFAEKAAPGWIYSGARDMLLVFPNLGHESARKFIVYRFVSASGQDEEVSYVDRLPRLAAYRASRLGAGAGAAR
ncbi:hypothetical protein CSQ96_23015 [Janthinobacterium sp. BJB412]|nr:hypothetical protein CSQ96_23015 [Janthinobacterium sp. BJB412]